MARVYNWQIGREMSYCYPGNRPQRQFAAVFDTNKCIACAGCIYGLYRNAGYNYRLFI